MSNTETTELFITAARKKYRFDTTKGQVTVEDLFDLNLTSLDAIAVALDDKIQTLGRKSFIAKRSSSTTEVNNKLDIVKYVIETKQEEAAERERRASVEAELAYLQSIKEKKMIDKDHNLSLEELDARIASLKKK